MSVILVAVLLASSSRVCQSYLKVRSIPCTTSTSKSYMFKSVVDGKAETQSTNLISVARSFATSNLGVTDPTILADDFSCSGPGFNGIDKNSYVAGLTKETAVFQKAMPDFDLRPYSFAVDESQPNTVWFKIRPRGTLTGPFSFKGEVYLPNQKVVEQPVQQLSVTIRSGLVTRVTAGYVIDRLTGNTGGLAGPLGILYALDEAPSKFDYSPPAVVLKQFFSRTKQPSKRKAAAVAPFPIAVMTSLAKRLLDTNFGAEDPVLLSADFQFSGPFVGPLGKGEFVALKTFDLKSSLPDLKTKNYCFEIDTLDPERVWLISKGSGTMTGPLAFGGKQVQKATGKEYESAPEAFSFSFNEQGLCYKATAGYILDKEQGNTKGLGGVYGILEAVGTPVPWWESRTFGELPGLMMESLFPSSKRVESAVDLEAPPAAPKGGFLDGIFPKSTQEAEEEEEPEPAPKRGFFGGALTSRPASESTESEPEPKASRAAPSKRMKKDEDEEEEEPKPKRGMFSMAIGRRDAGPGYPVEEEEE